MFEPSSQQEAYDMVYHGFELSEKLGYPILLRVTTRMAHSRAGVVTSPLKPENRMNCPEDGRQRFILLPALARKRFKSLLASQEAFTEASEIPHIISISMPRIKTWVSSRRVSLSIIFPRIIRTVSSIPY